jgi:hypothetical protein
VPKNKEDVALGDWTIFILSEFVAIILSWVFFRTVLNSVVGDILGMQRVKNRIRDKKFVRGLDIVCWIAIAAIVFFTDSETTQEAFLQGIYVGILAGFFISIRPEHIRE